MPVLPLSEAQVRSFVTEMLGDDVHAARLRSISDGVLGVLHAGELGVHAIGRGLAAARGLVDKHAVQQLDRLLSNDALQIWALSASWVPAVGGRRPRCS